jgi:hypothetical protein
MLFVACGRALSYLGGNSLPMVGFDMFANVDNGLNNGMGIHDPNSLGTGALKGDGSDIGVDRIKGLGSQINYNFGGNLLAQSDGSVVSLGTNSDANNTGTGDTGGTGNPEPTTVIALVFLGLGVGIKRRACKRG